MPKTPDYFVGKTIIITGAASGIGRTTAQIFAREGANVVCADVNGDGARQIADQIGGQGRKALGLRIDVTAREQVDDMVRQSIAAFGSVQFQFNSAGAALRRSKFLDIDDALFERTFALNVKGTLYCMQAILPHDMMVLTELGLRARTLRVVASSGNCVIPIPPAGITLTEEEAADDHPRDVDLHDGPYRSLLRQTLMPQTTPAARSWPMSAAVIPSPASTASVC